MLPYPNRYPKTIRSNDSMNAARPCRVRVVVVSTCDVGSVASLLLVIVVVLSEGVIGGDGLGEACVLLRPFKPAKVEVFLCDNFLEGGLVWRWGGVGEGACAGVLVGTCNCTMISLQVAA
mmetsp:Transcript_89657/g.187267  ORF Transcript_89657/g.187267 Transcript_89657/m.187267 type:complete len:120 (+) Transcript_89657:1053-1412(+)